jgi:hypothetical protein
VADEFVEKVRYVADISDIQDKIGRLKNDQAGLSSATGSTASRMGSAFGRMASGIGMAAVVTGSAVASVGAAAVVLGPKILEQGAALEAMGKKSATVFEGSLGSVQAWATVNAKSLGMTQKELVGTAAGVADLLKPMGFSATQAAGMSENMLDLSGALSAWTGGTRSAADVAGIITKAMLGERDGLKELGVSISEADVQAQLAANGQDKLTGAALEQAKALATQQLIMGKSGDAQKAWANGSMDAIKQQNGTRAAISTLKETLVTELYPALQGLLPYITTAAEWLGKNLPAAMAVVRDWVREHWPAIKAVIMTAVDKIREGISGFVTFVQDAWAKWGDKIMAVVNFAWPAIRDLIGATIEVIRGIIKTVTDLITGDWSGVWNGIKDIVSGIWDGIKVYIETAIKAIGLVISGAASVITGAASAIWDGITAGVSAAWNGIKTAVSTAIDAVVGFVTGIPGKIGSAASTIWSGITGAASTAWSGIKTTVSTAITDIVGFVTGIPGKIGELVTNFATMGKNLGSAIINGVGDGVETLLTQATDIAKKFVNSIIGFINTNLIDKMNRLFEFTIPVPFSDGIKINPPDIPNIPKFHSGGVVPGGSGRETLALLRSGEVVFTRDQMQVLGDVISGSRSTGGTVINGMTVSTPDAKSFLDEGMWRLAG